MSMALSLHLRCFSLHRHNNYLPPSIIRRCTTTLTRAASSNSYETRRSANYKPNTWDYDLLESLPTNNYEMKKKHIEEREKMIAEVKGVLSDPSMDSLRRLELVDAVDRLGLKRHFQQEIEVACVVAETGDLHTTAVRFRLLRQHGYLISEDVFNKFKDQSGNICNVFLEDTKGLLSLYEASFMESRRDESLGKIRGFVAQHLKQKLSCLSPKLAKEVKKALELPLHWRFPRLKPKYLKYLESGPHGESYAQPNMDTNLVTKFAQENYTSGPPEMEDNLGHPLGHGNTTLGPLARATVEGRFWAAEKEHSDDAVDEDMGADEEVKVSDEADITTTAGGIPDTPPRV